MSNNNNNNNNTFLNFSHPRFYEGLKKNNNNNKQTFQNAKLTLKSRTGARGGYNQKHANH